MKPLYYLLTYLLKALSNSTKALDLNNALTNIDGAFYKALSCAKGVYSFDLSACNATNLDS